MAPRAGYLGVESRTILCHVCVSKTPNPLTDTARRYLPSGSNPKAIRPPTWRVAKHITSMITGRRQVIFYSKTPGLRRSGASFCYSCFWVVSPNNKRSILGGKASCATIFSASFPAVYPATNGMKIGVLWVGWTHEMLTGSPNVSLAVTIAILQAFLLICIEWCIFRKRNFIKYLFFCCCICKLRGDVCGAANNDFRGRCFRWFLCV